MVNFMRGLNVIKTADGKFTKTIGGYIASLKKLQSQDPTINELEIRNELEIYEIIDRANNEQKIKNPINI